MKFYDDDDDEDWEDEWYDGFNGPMVVYLSSSSNIGITPQPRYKRR